MENDNLADNKAGENGSNVISVSGELSSEHSRPQIENGKNFKQRYKKKKKKNGRLWPLKVFIISIILGLFFSFLSETAISGTHIAVAAVVLGLLIIINIVFDMVGIAFATCDSAPFNAMAARKIKGAKTAIKMLQKAEIVSNICNDVVGDICGIVSGAAGVSIALKLITAFSASGNLWPLLITIVAGSLIGALTVSGKAAFKRIGIGRSKEIVFAIAKFLTLFRKEK